MYKSLLISVIAVSAFVSGCASVPTAPKEKDAEAKTFTVPASNSSNIYIYRDSFVGQALKKNVYVNGTLLGETSNKVFFLTAVNPGTQKLSTESEFSDNSLELKTEGGKNYFVEQYIKMGAFVGGAALKVVSEEEGKKKVAKCKLAKQK
jgi:Protein of unknown function (DUF2846)